MRYSTLIKISIAVAGLSACAPAITKGFRRAGAAAVAAQDLYPFWTPQRTHLFAMKIDFRENHFSGLLLVKQTDTAHYRLVFNTHFGMGVFDFEFARDTFLVHSCLDLLHRKRVLRLLEKDFRTLLFLDVKPHGNAAAVYHSPADSSLEVNRIGGRYYLKNNAQKTLLKMDVPHRFSSGAYDFTSYHDHFPEMITVTHSRLGLQIALEKIRNTPNE